MAVAAEAVAVAVAGAVAGSGAVWDSAPLTLRARTCVWARVTNTPPPTLSVTCGEADAEAAADAAADAAVEGRE